jgi:hypothetical protein
MARKTAGLVVVIICPHVYIVDWRDLAEWKMCCHRRSDHPSVFQRLAFVNKTKELLECGTPHFHLSLLIGRRAWRTKFIELYRLQTVEVRAVPANPEMDMLRPSTFVTFDERKTSRLHIGRGHSGQTWVTPRQFDAIIPHISLPGLEIIRIEGLLAPGAFTSFLANHPGISCIEFYLQDGGSSVPLMLTTRTIQLPKLTHLQCWHADNLVPLLNSFHLSPNLLNITLPFTSFAQGDLKRGLRRLSLHASPVRLTFNLQPVLERTQHPPFDAEDRLTTSCLYCVQSLFILADTTVDVGALLAWAACLPKLRSLQIKCTGMTGAFTATTLAQGARAILPGVEICTV